jgi:hypothetical protein
MLSRKPEIWVGPLLKDLEWVRKADPDIPFHIERAARCEHDARRLDQRGTKLRRRHIDIDLDQANRRCLRLALSGYWACHVRLHLRNQPLHQQSE